MTNIKIFIGMLMFYILAQLWCNATDGLYMLTNANAADLGDLSSSSVTSSTDSSGAPAQYVSAGASFFTTIGKVIFFNYTIFKNIDGTPNDWSLLRYFLMVIGIAILVDAAIVFRQLFSG
jgi:hypothetical protein